MNHERLRTKLKPVAKTMQYGLCFLFLFAAILLSIEWQLKSLLLPLFSIKSELAVIVNPECVNKIISSKDNYSISADCLRCKLMPGLTELKKCHFTTSGAGQVKVAKSVIENQGLNFNTFGYIADGQAYLRYNPYPFLLLHIPIWIFGLFPFFLFAYKKPTHS